MPSEILSEQLAVAVVVVCCVALLTHFSTGLEAESTRLYSTQGYVALSNLYSAPTYAELYDATVCVPPPRGLVSLNASGNTLIARFNNTESKAAYEFNVTGNYTFPGYIVLQPRGHNVAISGGKTCPLY
ncbi:MAG: hypothetical protein QXI37_03455 [Thermoprotei archaeon]